jgi:hypothetical protein
MSKMLLSILLDRKTAIRYSAFGGIVHGATCEAGNLR